MNCQADTLLNVFVDNGLSLNVMPKTTMSILSYQGTPMWHNGVVVKYLMDQNQVFIIKHQNFTYSIHLFLYLESLVEHHFHPLHQWVEEKTTLTYDCSTIHDRMKKENIKQHSSSV